MLRRNFEGLYKVRKEGALERQAERAKLTPQQQLAKLDKAGFFAAKERARLSKLIDLPKQASIQAAVAPKTEEAKDWKEFQKPKAPKLNKGAK